MTVDWYYHRNGCTTCGRAQAYLARHRIEPEQVVDAKKTRFGADEALKMARAARVLYVTKGKKVIRLDVTRSQPTDDELLALLVGRSGYLRAPALRAGHCLFVGFEPAMFEREL
ncbi:MAG TPA: ArsC family (seleno)protein [Candidatus Binatia bacterium]|nr:ArsC family (seleno)protein [Candidatus Binatia bacterium]